MDRGDEEARRALVTPYISLVQQMEITLMYPDQKRGVIVWVAETARELLTLEGWTAKERANLEAIYHQATARL